MDARVLAWRGQRLAIELAAPRALCVRAVAAYTNLPKRKSALQYIQRSNSQSSRSLGQAKALKTPRRQPRSTEDDDKGGSGIPDWISSLYSRWKEASPSQQAYLVVAAVAALFLLPRALILAFVGLERLFVGLLLEIEELMVALTLKTIAATGIVIVLALAAAGIYIFFLEKKRPR